MPRLLNEPENNLNVATPLSAPQESGVEAHGHGPLLTDPHDVSALPDALSVDVEDYYHVEAFADRIRPETWSQYPSRVVENTRRVLELFREFGVRATFFVLGYVAEREPALVREILAAGHEVGCHSHWHRRVFQLTPQEFREDLRRARGTIEDAGGMKVVGFRAPTFSIGEKSLWAIEILAQEGFLYDSSVFPIRHDLYGFPNAPRFPFRWLTPNDGPLFEIPLLTVRVLGRNLPAGGGGYLRILPMWYTRWALRRVRQREGRPAVVYFHPWELDPGQPRLPGSLKSKLRHYSNLGSMERHLRELLKDGRFVSLKTFLENHLATGQIFPDIPAPAG
jgi:polysaccharide deacetylase family protein (PEP-CTERM system associated)